MNKIDLTNKVIDPKSVTKNDLEELEKLSKKYSYSSVFSLLYLSGLAKTEDFNFDEELKNHAYRIPDRIRLYELTNTEEKIESIIAQDNVTETDLEKDATESLDNTNLTENSAPTIATTNLAKHNTESDTEELAIDATPLQNNEETSFTTNPNNEKLEEIKIAENTTEYEEETEVEPAIKDTVDIDILATAVSRSIEQEIEEEYSGSEEEIKLEEKFSFELDRTAEVEEILDNENSTIDNTKTTEVIEKDDDESLNTTSKETENTKNSGTKKSFLEWLKDASNNTPITTKEIKEVKEEEIEEVKSKFDSIVDKFIDEQPKITRPTRESLEKLEEKEKLIEADIIFDKPKREFFSPTRVAKKSLDDSTLPVSETLAKIFASQGNFPKAIESYQQLMLKFPEKKSFFANRIKELEQKLNKK